MKSLKRHIQENLKFKINRDTKVSEYYPKTWDELRQIIEQRYKEQGPGTEQNPIDLNDIDVSGMKIFYNTDNHMGLFEYIEFKYIDISEWDVSNVEDMRHMFYFCKDLKSVGDLSNWDISNVNIFYGKYCMFYGSGIINKPDWYEE